MRTQIDRQDAVDAILPAWESDAAFDAWTLEELDDDLGSLRPAFAGSDDAGG
jgi:hypothetical protein